MRCEGRLRAKWLLDVFSAQLLKAVCTRGFCHPICSLAEWQSAAASPLLTSRTARMSPGARGCTWSPSPASLDWVTKKWTDSERKELKVGGFEVNRFEAKRNTNLTYSSEINSLPPNIWCPGAIPQHYHINSDAEGTLLKNSHFLRYLLLNKLFPIKILHKNSRTEYHHLLVKMII